jgi:hypothetical protein
MQGVAPSRREGKDDGAALPNATSRPNAFSILLSIPLFSKLTRYRSHMDRIVAEGRILFEILANAGFDQGIVKCLKAGV